MYHILTKLASVFVMIVIGVLARRSGVIGGGDTRRMAKLLTSVVYPALIFSAVTGNFSARGLLASWTLPAGAFMIMLLGYGIGIAGRQLIKFRAPQEQHAFLFQCTINNYAFLPLPLALLYFGDAGVAALILSTLGSEIAVWTIGIVALTGQPIGIRSVKHLLSMPLLAIAAAVLVITVRDLLLPDSIAVLLHGPASGQMLAALTAGLEMLGAAAIPLAMLIAGSRMAELRPHNLLTVPQSAVAVLRLIAVPAVVMALLHLLPLPLPVVQILMLVAVMPSAIVSVVLSEIHGADTDFAAASVLMTHVACLVTIPLWLALFLTA